MPAITVRPVFTQLNFFTLAPLCHRARGQGDQAINGGSYPPGGVSPEQRRNNGAQGKLNPGVSIFFFKVCSLILVRRPTAHLPRTGSLRTVYPGRYQARAVGHPRNEPGRTGKAKTPRLFGLFAFLLRSRGEHTLPEWTFAELMRLKVGPSNGRCDLVQQVGPSEFISDVCVCVCARVSINVYALSERSRWCGGIAWVLPIMLSF